jgi:2-polyprenyl-3-methyl-5-hydroxy-6-metoxy-1,4-benzoquinol methylase
MRFDDETMNRYYTNYQGEEFIEQRVKFEPSFGKRLLQRTSNNYFRLRGESISYTNVINDLIKEVVKSTDIKVLDFGGGTGSNSPFRGDAEIDLIELGDEDQTQNLRSYDVVSILNVLEHVMDPIDVLRRAGEFAKQRGGFVVIEVPFESFMQEQNPTIWMKKKIWTEHVNCFSKNGLEKCMNLAGLEIVKEAFLIRTGRASEEIRENNAAFIAIGAPSS